MSYEAEEGSRYSGAPIEYYKFTSGSTVWRFTSGDVLDAIADPSSSHDYTPAVIGRKALDYSSEDRSGQIEVTMERDNPVAQLFRAYTPPAPVGLVIYRRHRRDAEVVVVFIGTIVSAAHGDQETTLTCASISNVFKLKVPALLYEPLCTWALYGPGCQVDKSGFKTTAVLDVVDGVTLTDTAFGGHPSGWFTNGWVERANGERRFIVNHVGNDLTLMNAFPADLAAGESVDAYAGCDRSESTCQVKFSNLDNHLGFARIPSRNPHDGRNVFPP